MTTEQTLDLADLLSSWQLVLRSERKSPATVKVYSDGVVAFFRWCETEGVTPELDKRLVQRFTSALLEQGAEAATARSRQLSLRRFSAWLTEEGEQGADPLAGIRPPKIDVKVTDPLTDDELKALIKSCAGKDFRARRDEAMIRLMAETGLRAGEVIGMQLAEVDLQRGLATVRRGKGGKGRMVPFGAQTATSIDRYLRARKSHRLADSPALWLGDRSRGFTYDALHKTLKGRADAAGIERFHPHLMRHTAATRWLAAGGSEGGLMAVAGWARRDMIDRYTAATATGRAADESRKLNLGDF